MKELKAYITEGIFDIDDNIDKIDKYIKLQIKQFLNHNYYGYTNCKISRKPNNDGKYEVTCSKNIEVKNKNIVSLTNDAFVWADVGGDFICHRCYFLKFLEGAPKKVGGSFYCEYCASLTSLEGAPEEVDKDFNCIRGDSLNTLKGAPREVGGNFKYINCKIKFTEEEIKKVSNVKKYIIC